MFSFVGTILVGIWADQSWVRFWVWDPKENGALIPGAPVRLSWARLLKRVFDIDIAHCPDCGGSLKIIACPEPRRRAAIEDPPVIVKILTHLGLPTHAPARRFDLFQTA